MCSGAKRQMAVRPPFDIQRLGVGELRRIAISGADAKMNIGTCVHFHATDDCIMRDTMVPELVGAFKSQEFFDR